MERLRDAQFVVAWLSCGEEVGVTPGGWLTADESSRAAAMPFTKRRREWLLARWTAKQAIAGFRGWAPDPDTLARIEIRAIPNGEQRGAPEVYVDGARHPLGVSLTDRAGWAVAAVGEVEDLGPALELGCDLELVEPRSPEFVAGFLTAREQDAVRRPPFELSGDAMANLIWSAKESALKVLRCGLRRDTRTVEVMFPSAGRTAGPTAGWRPLLIGCDEGRELAGWWHGYGSFLLTVATARPQHPPRSLAEPPALATARPSHSWLASP